jgi:RES domain-containing protein
LSEADGYRELWRISNHNSLEGLGGRFAAGRWHTAGHPIVYLAESPAGSLLEVLVHLDLEDNDLPGSYNLMRVIVPGDIEVERLSAPEGEFWKRNEQLTQAIGDEWLKSARTALAVVSSAIMPETRNYLLNPEHPDARRIQIASVTVADFDPRLLRKVIP